jgi:hypothetical protein
MSVDVAGNRSVEIRWHQNCTLTVVDCTVVKLRAIVWGLFGVPSRLTVASQCGVSVVEGFPNIGAE